MEIDKREVLRYLGYGSHEADAAVHGLIDECEAELSRAAQYRSLVREFPLVISPEGEIDGGCFRTYSKNLRKNLGGCEAVLVMAATIGPGVDRLLARYGKLSVTKAVVIQAAAAALIEAYCNELCRGWKQEYEEKGFYLRPRFSPGYGDFPLACQEQIIGGLEAGKRIGITLTDGLLMMPSKSVTAVIGVSKNQDFCHIEGCEVCGKKDCAYRRG